MVAINEREITIVRRYFIKQDYAPKGLHRGDVVIIIRNDKGDEYAVTLRRNKAHSCTCAAGQHSRKCYHVSTLVQVENARIEARKAAKNVVETPAQPIVPPIAMELPAELRGYRKTAVSTDTSSLNGAQQSAGLLSILPSRKKSA